MKQLWLLSVVLALALVATPAFADPIPLVPPPDITASNVFVQLAGGAFSASGVALALDGWIPITTDPDTFVITGVTIDSAGNATGGTLTILDGNPGNILLSGSLNYFGWQEAPDGLGVLGFKFDVTFENSALLEAMEPGYGSFSPLFGVLISDSGFSTVGDFATGFDNSRFATGGFADAAPVPIPEPATAGLLAGAVLAWFWMKRGRRPTA